VLSSFPGQSRLSAATNRRTVSDWRHNRAPASAKDQAPQAAFEVDSIDEHSRTGWSVIIEGVTADITTPKDIGRLNRLGLEPWAPGHKPHWVQIRARTVSGRRITLSAGMVPGHYLG
jgi:hypothetical protein